MKELKVSWPAPTTFEDKTTPLDPAVDLKGYKIRYQINGGGHQFIDVDGGTTLTKNITLPLGPGDSVFLSVLAVDNANQLSVGSLGATFSIPLPQKPDHPGQPTIEEV